MPLDRLMLFPPSVYADAPLAKVMPAKVVPAAKSLLSDVTLDVPKISASLGAAAPPTPDPPTQFAELQKLPAGLVLHVAFAPCAERCNPITEAAAAARITAFFAVVARRI